MEPRKLPPADADVGGAAAGTYEYQDANDDEGMVWISRMELIACWILTDSTARNRLKF